MYLPHIGKAAKHWCRSRTGVQCRRVDVQYVMSRYAIALGVHTDYTRSPIDQRDQQATSYMCACKPSICHVTLCARNGLEGVCERWFYKTNTLPRCSDCRCSAMYVCAKYELIVQKSCLSDNQTMQKHKRPYSTGAETMGEFPQCCTVAPTM